MQQDLLGFEAGAPHGDAPLGRRRPCVGVGGRWAAPHGELRVVRSVRVVGRAGSWSETLFPVHHTTVACGERDPPHQASIFVCSRAVVQSCSRAV
eukprot:2123565-Prymnesium_polylepis.1